jgi:integrase
MANFNFYLKSTKVDQPTPIRLRITAHGSSVYIYTGYKVKPSNWVSDKNHPYYMSVMRNNQTKDAGAINYGLNRILEIANMVKASFGKFSPTLNELKNRILIELNKENKNDSEPTSVETKSLYDFWEEHILMTAQKINPKTNKLITHNTIKCMKQTKSVVQRFEKHTRFKVAFDTLNMDFYQAFREYCGKHEKFKTNTFGKHIRNLKGVLKMAEIMGYNVNKQFKLPDFIAPKELTPSIYLTEAEIDQFINLDLSQYPGLSKTRDFFVIGCYTGLRWSDYADMNKAEMVGEHKIRIVATKTQKALVCGIPKPIRGIFYSFMNGNQFCFPKSISNQKFNKQLKEIAVKISTLHTPFRYKAHVNGVEFVEIKQKWEMVCSHTCRRSFATNAYNKGMSITDIMKLTGHRSEKQLLEYIKITPEQAADRFMALYE